MKNLRWHSCGVFGNVYRGTLLSPSPRREIAVKKTWPDVDKKHCRVNLELNILLGLSREKHKNIVQILYTFRSITPDKKVCESMVFDYMPMTLSVIIKQIGGKHPNYLDIKLYTWQLFNGLMFLFHMILRKVATGRAENSQTIRKTELTGGTSFPDPPMLSE
ncbi:unnamed protein product [Toxocara canis]|uniref:Protein kinase domain-containing protein n=1 Tax=Toxocara canis TaxID=6265 RepID=A0A183V9Z0_TOXCA|nr:unnamed protein product [Toxocara canis]